MKFDVAFEKLIGHEGGFQKGYYDRGNWTTGKVGVGELKGTKFGISAMTYQELDIANITLDQAKSIYKRDFWEKVAIPEIPESIHFALFDMAVNSGVHFSITVLQKAVGSSPDGVIGPKTIEAIKQYSPQILVNRINAMRLIELTNMSAFSIYGNGWVRRVARNILDDNMGRLA